MPAGHAPSTQEGRIGDSKQIESTLLSVKSVSLGVLYTKLTFIALFKKSVVSKTLTVS